MVSHADDSRAGIIGCVMRTRRRIDLARPAGVARSDGLSMRTRIVRLSFAAIRMSRISLFVFWPTVALVARLWADRLLTSRFAACVDIGQARWAFGAMAA
jgi:hypothetical protein